MQEKQYSQVFKVTIKLLVNHILWFRFFHLKFIKPDRFLFYIFLDYANQTKKENKQK